MPKQLMKPAVWLGLIAAICIIAYVMFNTVQPAKAGFTGCHVGAHVGYGAGGVELSDESDKVTLGASGAAYGLLAGCDVEIERFVVGAYGDLTWYNAKERNTIGSGRNAETVEVEIDRKWAIGARAGVKLNDAALAYVKLGYAQGRGFGETLTGYDIGGGLEVGFAENMYLLADYTYTNWKDRSEFDDKEEVGRIDSDQHVARVGVLYRFNMGSTIKE